VFPWNFQGAKITCREAATSGPEERRVVYANGLRYQLAAEGVGIGAGVSWSGESCEGNLFWLSTFRLVIRGPALRSFS